MPNTAVEVCNLALGWCESPSRIESLEENTTAARVCKNYYEPLRKRLLRSFPWSWATTDRRLVPSDIQHSIYPNAYVYPEDFLTISLVHQAGSEREETFHVEVCIINDQRMKLVLTDMSELYARGILDVQEGFDSEFVEYFALALAESISKPLEVPPSLQDRIALKRIELMSYAKAGDSKQSKKREVLPSWFEDRVVTGYRGG